MLESFSRICRPDSISEFTAHAGNSRLPASAAVEGGSRKRTNVFDEIELAHCFAACLSGGKHEANVEET